MPDTVFSKGGPEPPFLFCHTNKRLICIFAMRHWRNGASGFRLSPYLPRREPGGPGVAKRKGLHYGPRHFNPVDGDQYPLRGRCVWGHDDRAVRRGCLKPERLRSRSRLPHRLTRQPRPVGSIPHQKERELPPQLPLFVCALGSEPEPPRLPLQSGDCVMLFTALIALVLVQDLSLIHISEPTRPY